MAAALLRSCMSARLCRACEARLQMSAAGRHWLQGSVRSMGRASSSTNSATAAVKQQLKSGTGSMLLYELHPGRYKYYYLALFVGLMPVPMYFNEKSLLASRWRVLANREARANVLKKPLPNNHRSMIEDAEDMGGYDKLILRVFMGLAAVSMVTVVILAFRVVTKWQYNPVNKMHTVTTFTPWFRQRALEIPDKDISRLIDYKNRARVKVKTLPIFFTLDLAGGTRPNIQMYNIVLGSGRATN